MVFASGSFTLEGQVRGFSPESVELFDGQNVFVIERKKLGSAETHKLKLLKSGQKIQLQVPFEAVAAVRDMKILSDK